MAALDYMGLEPGIRLEGVPIQHVFIVPAPTAGLATCRPRRRWRKAVTCPRAGRAGLSRCEARRRGPRLRRKDCPPINGGGGTAQR